MARRNRRFEDKLEALETIDALMDAEWKAHGSTELFEKMCRLRNLVQRSW